MATAGANTPTAVAPASQVDTGAKGAGWGPLVQNLPGNIAGNQPPRTSNSVSGETDGKGKGK